MNKILQIDIIFCEQKKFPYYWKKQNYKTILAITQQAIPW